MDDPDWRAENAIAIKNSLEAFYNLAKELLEADGEEFGLPERWLMSVLQARIRMVAEAMEELRTRTALSTALYEVWNDVRWYLRRRPKPNGRVARELLSAWVRLLAPFAPHICEEIWELMGGEGFVSVAPWPEPDESRIDVEAEVEEKLLMDVLEDTNEIMKVLKKERPKRICYYVAAPWKWHVYLVALDMAREGRLELRELMKKLMAEPEMRKKAKEVADIARQIVEDIRGISAEERERRAKLGALDELGVLKEAADFLARELRAGEVLVFSEEDPERYDPAKRARLARPFRPAIYVE